MNEHPFSDDWYLMLEMNELKKFFNISTIIETGTWKGNTAYILSSLFDEVITIEIDEKFYEEAEWLDEVTNITRLLGDSSYWLDFYGKLHKNDKPVMFFLDAHSFGHGCPLRSELDSLIANKMSKSILVIHDCLVPSNDELGYDTYDEKPISFEFIKHKLDELYGVGEYTYSYNREAIGEKRGVLFVIPNFPCLVEGI